MSPDRTSVGIDGVYATVDPNAHLCNQRIRSPVIGLQISIGARPPKPIPTAMSFELSGLNVNDRQLVQSILNVFLLSKLKMTIVRLKVSIG